VLRAIGQVKADGRFTGGHGSESIFSAEVPVPVEIPPVPGAGERSLRVVDQGATRSSREPMSAGTEGEDSSVGGMGKFLVSVEDAIIWPPERAGLSSHYIYIDSVVWEGREGSGLDRVRVGG